MILRLFLILWAAIFGGAVLAKFLVIADRGSAKPSGIGIFGAWFLCASSIGATLLSMAP
jgi:hypothetical protein